MKNKVFIVVTIIMVMMLAQFSVLTGSVKADISTGSDGNVSWSFDSKTGTLTFSGSGALKHTWRNSIEEENVSTIIINSGITSLEWTACTARNLKSITIPNTVTDIKGAAFYDCRSLTSITIPESVTNIESDAFDYCRSLTNINVDSNNNNYSSDDMGVLFNKDKTELIVYPIGIQSTSYVIPNSVKRIGAHAFYASNLKNIEIPDGVISIGSSAFCQSSLESLNIPSSVTSVTGTAFTYCSWLKGISVDSNNEYYCSDDNGILFNKEKTTLVYYPLNDESYVIPDSVIDIDTSAFFSSELKDIIIPYGVKRIGNSAFSYSNLEKVKIPDSVIAIGNSAFSSCRYLTSIIIPNSVTEIGVFTFSSGYAENEITIYCQTGSKALENTSDNIKHVIDDTPPTINLLQDGNYIEVVAEDNEEEVGLAIKPYSLNKEEWYESNRIAVDKSQEYTVYVKDALGNMTQKSISIDLDAPIINGLTVNANKIIINAKDELSGLAEKAYSLDGENWQSSKEFNVSKTGKYTIYVRDVAGNIATDIVNLTIPKTDNTDSENTENQQITEDKENEEKENDKTNKDNNQTKDTTAPEILNIQVNGYTIKVEAKDSESGLADKAYSLDNKTWQSSNEITVEKNGQYMIYVKDKEGNIANRLVKVTTKYINNENNTNNSNGDSNSKTSTETTNVEKTTEDKTQAKTVLPQTGTTLPIAILTVVSIIGFVEYKKFKKVDY